MKKGTKHSRTKKLKESSFFRNANATCKNEKDDKVLQDSLTKEMDMRRRYMMF